MDQKKILIVGGRFGGIAAALELENYLKVVGETKAKFILVPDKPHFEFHPALYRVVTGNSPLEVCIPLREIFADKNIEVIGDRINSINIKENSAEGQSGSHYQFDYLILALGSETDYFNIFGLDKFSFGFKSISEAIRLKNHVHQLFEACKKAEPEEKVCLLKFVVVGGGPSGVELSVELAKYLNKLTKQHGIHKSLISIDLVEASERILPMFSENISKKAEARLKNLGVKVLKSSPVSKEKIQEIEINGVKTKTGTVIWTAGAKPNSLYQKIEGLKLDEKGRVVVSENLLATGAHNIFVIGDGASTKFSGMAQTAIDQGKTAALNTIRLLKNSSPLAHREKKPYYSIPIGSRWALTILDAIIISGYLGWIIRRLADFRYFYSILPLGKALSVFRSSRNLCEMCQICGKS